MCWGGGACFLSGTVPNPTTGSFVPLLKPRLACTSTGLSKGFDPGNEMGDGKAGPSPGHGLLELVNSLKSLLFNRPLAPMSQVG